MFRFTALMRRARCRRFDLYPNSRTRSSLLLYDFSGLWDRALATTPGILTRKPPSVEKKSVPYHPARRPRLQVRRPPSLKGVGLQNLSSPGVSPFVPSRAMPPNVPECPHFRWGMGHGAWGRTEQTG